MESSIIVAGSFYLKRTIAIAGGGLAGIAAAVRLTESGCRVVLVETRGKLGGRATSFDDPRGGGTLDNCQHVVMGCCTNLLDLYQRLGVIHHIRWGNTTWWSNPPHEPDELKPSNWLPAPLHFALAFARIRFLASADKRAVARAMRRMIRMGHRGRSAWESRSFSEFLKQERQTERAVTHLWEPVIVGACNLPCAQVCAAAAIKVIQEGFLQDKWSPSIGLPAVPLVRLYDTAAAIIESGGGEVRLRSSVTGIGFDGSRVTGLVTEDGMVEASAVVSALPPERLHSVCSGTLQQADWRLSRLDKFESSPIVGVHLFFSQAVMRVPHLVLPGRATHWLFDKGTDAEGRHHIHAVVSAAHQWMELSEEQIVARVLADIRWALPSSLGLEPLAFRSVKEKRATIALTPQAQALRPTAAADGRMGGVRNLFLAGDWCATGWPATMESAVRSGYLAATACVRFFEPALKASGGADSKGLVADVPPARLSAFLGLRP